MAEYTLRIRRYSPESGDAAHWDDFTIDLEQTDEGPEISYSEVTITQWEPEARTY